MFDFLRDKRIRFAPIRPIRISHAIGAICTVTGETVAAPDTLYFTNEGKQTGNINGSSASRCRLQGEDYLQAPSVRHYIFGRHHC